MNIRIAIAQVLLLCVFIAAPAAHAQGQKQRPSTDRIYLRDIEGIWINDAYLKALTQSRSPHAVARKVSPLVIALKREGRAWPIVVTDFNRASMEAVLDVEPTAKPGAYRLVVGAEDRPMSSSEVKYVPFEGTRNSQGRFDKLRIAEPTFLKGKPADFVLLAGELSPALNRIVLAGRYRDEKGGTWEFTEGGEARTPDQTFLYEISLNDPGAGCEYLQSEDLRDGDQPKRFGFAWKGEKLSILPARLVGKKVVCEARPLAVLTPQ